MAMTYNQRRASRLKRAKMCVDCGRKAAARRRTRCLACLRRLAESAAVHRAEARGRGVCYECGKKIKVPARCDSCKSKRSSDKSGKRERKMTKELRGVVGRAKKLSQMFASILLLRTGRWTVSEWADELGVHPRTAYRMIAALRRCGITIEVSREREHVRGQATPLYTIPADPLRKLLRL
jgi:predicted transcriptional regulator